VIHAMSDEQDMHKTFFLKSILTIENLHNNYFLKKIISFHLAFWRSLTNKEKKAATKLYFTYYYPFCIVQPAKVLVNKLLCMCICVCVYYCTKFTHLLFVSSLHYRGLV